LLLYKRAQQHYYTQLKIVAKNNIHDKKL